VDNKKKLKDDALPKEIFEGNLINVILRDKENIKFYRDNINPDNFSFTPAKETVRLIFNFYDKYKRSPEQDELTQELAGYLEKENKPIPENFFHELWTIIFEPTDIEYPRDKLLEWIRSSALKKAVLDALEFEKKSQTLKAVNFLAEKMDDIKRTGIPKFDDDTIEEIEETEIRWLWRFKIPLGTISLITGYPGVSKSYFSMMMAASVSKGLPFPGEHFENVSVKGSVIILSAEDDPGATIKRRLRIHDADQKKIHLVGVSKDFLMFNLKTDLQYLEDLITKIGDVKLVIVDPVSAYLGADMKFDSYKDTHVKSVLSPALELAKKHELALLLIMHLNKKEDSAVINRISGSGAFMQVPRAAWLIAKSRYDKGLFHFVCMKHNLGEKPKGLAYRIKNEKITIEDFSDESEAEDLLTRDYGKTSQRQDARDFLMEMAKIKKEWDAEEVEKKRKEEGIGKRTLDSAKKDLNMKSIKFAGENGKQKWVWILDDKKE